MSDKGLFKRSSQKKQFIFQKLLILIALTSIDVERLMGVLMIGVC